MTDDEIAALLHDIESDRVERTESAKNADKIAEAILFGVEGMRHLGSAFQSWKRQWGDAGACPMGYVVGQHAVRLDRPVASQQKWMARIPGEFQSSILGNKRRSLVSSLAQP